MRHANALFFNKNKKTHMLASANRHFLTPTLNAAASGGSGQLALWRMPYLAVHKETSAEAPQEEKKLSQRLSKRCFFFFFLFAERGQPWARAYCGGK